MNEDGRNFTEPIAGFAPGGFNASFSKAAKRIGVETALTPRELSSLYGTAFLAAICNIAFNGPGASGGEIKSEGEATRRKLEQTFMAARDTCFASPGWRALPEPKRRLVQEVFLSVFVTEDNLVE
jgi:hypothetical protein